MPILAFALVSFLLTGSVSAHELEGITGYSSAWFRTHQDWGDFWGAMMMLNVTVFVYFFIAKMLLRESNDAN